MESESGLDVPNTITFSLPFEIGGGGGGGDVVSVDAPTSLSIEDGKEYHLTNVSNLTITYPAGSFECYIYLETGDGEITIVFPESKYIGLAPVFGANEAWEISIKNGVIVAGVVS
jgi:hypothetical protein